MDKMTALQRVNAAVEFRPVDSVACMPLVMRYAAQRIEAPYSAYVTDPKTLVEAQLDCQAAFGYDYVTVCSDGYREAEGCGVELSFPTDSTPKVEKLAIEGPEDLAGKTVPDPTTTKRMADRVQSVRLLKKAVGDNLVILGWVEGPFACAAAMCGLESLLVNLHADPEHVRNVLEYALQVEIAFAKAQVDAGATMIGVGDAAASLIRPQHYETFALPYEARLLDAIKSMGAKVKLHICGNTTHLLGLMPRSGADVVNIDWMVDLQKAKDAFDGKICLKGNIDPVAELLQGTPASVRQGAIRDIEIGGYTGFILSPGCEVAPDTPEQNLLAYVEAAREAKGLSDERNRG